MTKVKICGIKESNVGKSALDNGADYLGFIVEVGYSKDNLSKEDAKRLMDKLDCKKVIVTILEDVDEIVELAEYLKPSIIQLSNKISIEKIKSIKDKIKKINKNNPIKITYTIHVNDEKSIEEAKGYAEVVDFILLDSGNNDRAGGTGKTHDWEISRKIVEAVDVPVFLAGGLNAENIAEAIEFVQPYGVDVNSGVKTDNVKDKDKIKKFIEAVK